MKRCSKCDLPKEESEFCKKLSGLNPSCRTCVAIANAKWRRESESSEKASQRAARKERKEEAARLLAHFNQKFCGGCGLLKSSEEFYTCRGRLSSSCKSCCQRKGNLRRAANPQAFRDRSKIQRRDNPDVTKGYHLKDSFGITFEEYRQKLTEQNGVCAVCNQGPEKRKLCVDHDHESGKIRGLLCGRCNTALGSLKESVVIIQALLEYLKKHS